MIITNANKSRIYGSWLVYNSGTGEFENPVLWLPEVKYINEKCNSK